MLVQCPKCRNRIRLTGFLTQARVQPYWCTGCRSIVRLDLAQDELKSSSSADSFQGLERPATVLLADRSTGEVEGAMAALRAAGYLVRFAETVSGAFEQIDREHPDLVMTALRLPGGGGLGLLRAIRDDPRLAATPVIVVSRICGDPVLDRLIRKDAQGFVPRDALQETVAFRARQVLAERALAR